MQVWSIRFMKPANAGSDRVENWMLVPFVHGTKVINIFQELKTEEVEAGLSTTVTPMLNRHPLLRMRTGLVGRPVLA